MLLIAFTIAFYRLVLIWGFTIQHHDTWVTYKKRWHQYTWWEFIPVAKLQYSTTYRYNHQLTVVSVSVSVLVRMYVSCTVQLDAEIILDGTRLWGYHIRSQQMGNC